MYECMYSSIPQGHRAYLCLGCYHTSLSPSKQASLSHLTLAAVISHLTLAAGFGPPPGRSISPIQIFRCTKHKKADSVFPLAPCPAPPPNAHRLCPLNLPPPTAERLHRPSIRDAPPCENHKSSIPNPIEKCKPPSVAFEGLTADEYAGRGGERCFVSAESRDKDGFVESAKEIEFSGFVHDS
jgi:hypothetical protein